MKIDEVTTTPDPTLPLDLPDLPHAITHMWVADSLLDNGEQIVPPVVGSINLTDGSGGATNLPTAGEVDGARALTFDGVNDGAYALNANPGPGGTITGYAIVKITADPAANRSIIHLSTAVMGFNSARKFYIGAAVVASAFVVGNWYVVGWAVQRNTGTGDALHRVAVSTGETAAVNSQNQGALPTFVTFGQGSGGTDTPMVVRALALNVGTAHSLAEMQEMVEALAEAFGI